MTVGECRTGPISYYVEGWRRISWARTVRVDLVTKSMLTAAGILVATGDSFVVKDLCPPLCHEFPIQYPFTQSLLNGIAGLCGEQLQDNELDAKCPQWWQEYVSMESSWKKIGQNRNEFLPVLRITVKT